MSKTEMIGTRVVFRGDSILRPDLPEKQSMEVKEALDDGWSLQSTIKYS